MRASMLLGLAMVLGCGIAMGQSTPTNRQQQTQPSGVGAPSSNNPAVAKMDQQRQQMLVDDRRKRILDDTEKLLTLATELKADVDKSTKNELSLDVIRKAAEIEKLAHDVKERMRN